MVEQQDLATARRIVEGAPFIRDLGLALTGAGEGWCETELVLAGRHLQQDGYVHAGVQATMADHTAGAAAATRAGPGRLVLTAEFKINLLRAARGERLRCRGSVLKTGRRLIVAESEVFCATADDERLVAKASVTLSVVAPPGAAADTSDGD